MIAGRLPAPRLEHALGGGIVVLAVIAIWPWVVPPRPPVPPPNMAQSSAPPPAVTSLPPIARYAAVVERPLFAPSRRAPPGATVAALGPTIEGRYRLIGIISAGTKRQAFITEGTRRAQIAEGDMLDGWTVKQIAQDRVLLRSATGDATLKLNRTPGEPPKPQ